MTRPPRRFLTPAGWTAVVVILVAVGIVSAIIVGS